MDDEGKVAQWCDTFGIEGQVSRQLLAVGLRTPSDIFWTWEHAADREAAILRLLQLSEIDAGPANQLSQTVQVTTLLVFYFYHKKRGLVLTVNNRQ